MKFFASFGYFLVLGVLTGIAQAITELEKAAITTKLVAVGIECIQNYPLTLSEIKSFKAKVVPDGENPKCFTACVFKKVGIMDNTGMLSPASTRKNAEHVFKGNEQHLKNVDEVMKTCSEVNQIKTSDGNRGCDRAKLAYKCLVDNGPKYGFDFDF